MKDQRRKGDDRAILQDTGLTFHPAHGQPIRWLPRHGEPLCILEWVSQSFVKASAWAVYYIAVIVTILLYVIVFGVPFVEGR